MINKGKGWRIGWRADAPVYKGLIGTDNWAIELTKEEMQDFASLLIKINQVMIDMSEHLMDEEKITCELDTDLLWLEASGFPHEYSLTVIFSQQRSCEVSFPADVIPSFINTVQSLNFDGAIVF